MHRLNLIRVIGLVALLLAACGTDEPATTIGTVPPTPEPVVIVVTATAEPTLPIAGTFVDRRPTLPPSFTPTATNTATLTPTITLTPTPTATFAVADICERFNLTINLIEGRSYDMVGFVDGFVDTGGSEINGLMAFRNTDSGEEIAFDIPGSDDTYPARFPLDLSTGPGPYTWTITAQTANYQDICESSGTFQLRPRSPVEVMFGALDSLIAEQAVPQVDSASAGTPLPEVTAEATP